MVVVAVLVLVVVVVDVVVDVLVDVVVVVAGVVEVAAGEALAVVVFVVVVVLDKVDDVTVVVAELLPPRFTERFTHSPKQTVSPKAQLEHVGAEVVVAGELEVSEEPLELDVVTWEDVLVLVPPNEAVTLRQMLKHRESP